MLADELSLPDICDWIAWLSRRPRGERRLDALMAIQTAHLRAAWVESEQDPRDFLPQWSTNATEPTNEAEELLLGFGMAERMNSLCHAG
ncbi:MAG: hypothetical protein KDA96_10195 [Planctomycetaceae bacterium]|nr:hypothetical protein [Planctomycetaceae bacterium]